MITEELRELGENGKPLLYWEFDGQWEDSGWWRLWTANRDNVALIIDGGGGNVYWKLFTDLESEDLIQIGWDKPIRFSGGRCRRLLIDGHADSLDAAKHTAETTLLWIIDRLIETNTVEVGGQTIQLVANQRMNFKQAFRVAATEMGLFKFIRAWWVLFLTFLIVGGGGFVSVKLGFRFEGQFLIMIAPFVGFIAALLSLGRK